MKAFVLQEENSNHLQLKDVEMPATGQGDVLIKTRAISINPVDTAVITNGQARNAMMKPAAGKTIIFGWDVAGEVIATGDAVSGLKKGDRVFGCVNFPGQGSTFAEQVAVPADQIAIIPAAISYETAAAACMAALTPWQGLITYGKITKSDKVLIHGAAGGVGHLAIQIAKYFGAYTIGTASAANKDFVLSLGADEVIDYKTEKFEEIVNDADLILDSVDAANLLRSVAATRPGGRIISLKASFDGEVAEKAKQKHVTGSRMGVQSNGVDIKKIADLLVSGKLRPAIYKTYPFADLPLAIEAMAQPFYGKLVVAVS